MALRSLWNKFRQQRSFFRTFSFRLITFATWIPVVITFNDFVAELITVNGPSMYPYLNAEKDQTTRRDVVLNFKYNAQDGLRRGMIVTFWNPYKPEVRTIKRIVGLPGDIVRTRSPYPVETVIVPEGHIWVEGDGPDRDTLDSNTFGPISAGLVIGKVTHIIWPLHRSGTVRWWEHAQKIRQRS
ncbi:LexA/Signal peptidase [Xylariaceae sp. FL0016]|nr:LexA/Signal peptidase [Xylariaceae sp. FL0016]